MLRYDSEVWGRVLDSGHFKFSSDGVDQTLKGILDHFCLMFDRAELDDMDEISVPY